MNKNNKVFSKKGVMIFLLVMTWNCIIQIYFLEFDCRKFLEIFIFTLILFVALGILEIFINT